MSTDEKEKSCETCDCWHEDECKNPYDCVDYNQWIPIESTLTPAQQYAPELLKWVREEHDEQICALTQLNLKHDEKTCPTCQLIAKAEGKE